MNNEIKKRSFTFVDENGDCSGRYIAPTPKRAAFKAFSALRRNNRNEDFSQCKEFQIKETTRGSLCKIYKYNGIYKTYNYKNHIVNMNGQRIIFSGRNIINKYK